VRSHRRSGPFPEPDARSQRRPRGLPSTVEGFRLHDVCGWSGGAGEIVVAVRPTAFVLFRVLATVRLHDSATLLETL
jgi:hypothetical protein